MAVINWLLYLNFVELSFLRQLIYLSEIKAWARDRVKSTVSDRGPSLLAKHQAISGLCVLQ